MTEQEQTENIETEKRNRRPNGLIIFALLAAAVFAISYKPSVEAIYCKAETLSPKPDVIMLGTSWCPYCYKARRYFVNNKISYCEYDIEKNAKGKNMYDGINNNPTMPLGIPVLFIGDYSLSGFDEPSVEKLLSEIK